MKGFGKDIQNNILLVEPTRKRVDQPINDWLRKQGYTGEFDRRYNVLILPLHMKGLFTYEAPYLRFSDHVPIDQMFIVDMRSEK